MGRFRAHWGWFSGGVGLRWVQLSVGLRAVSGWVGGNKSSLGRCRWVLCGAW